MSGTEYRRWLIAKGNVFLPSVAAVAKLVEKLRKERWIADPKSPDFARLRFEGKRVDRAKASGGYAVHTIENTYGKDLGAKIAASTEPLPAALDAEWLDHPDREEIRLVWPVDVVSGDAPVKYPFDRKPDGAVRWALEVHRAPEYVVPISDSFETIETTCACGEDLAFEWDDEEVVPAFGASTGIFAECEECSRTFDPSKRSAKITNPLDETSKELPGGAAYRFAVEVSTWQSSALDVATAFAPELVALVEAEFGRSFYQVGSIG
jgi:hypothetical protein